MGSNAKGKKERLSRIGVTGVICGERRSCESVKLRTRIPFGNDNQKCKNKDEKQIPPLRCEMTAIER